MKTKFIQLIFLVIAGLIVGWREWSNSVATSEETINITLQEVGSTNESTFVLTIFLLGVAMALFINSRWQASFQLSSPNSV